MNAPPVIGPNTVTCADALDFLRALPEASVDLVLTDPPYNIGKAEWDSWPSNNAYLAWLDGIMRELRRVLKANGSLYLFCAPVLAAQVELTVGRHFNVLNHITWNKTVNSFAEKYGVENFRGYVEMSERVIFAEQYGSGVGQSDYDAQLWAELTRPMKAWFRSAAVMHGISARDINAAVGSAQTGGGMATHYIGTSFTFELPTAEMFAKLKTAYPHAFCREYGDLKNEYDQIKKQFERERRPFNATPDRPYTDVWHYRTVNTYPGKHPCEKPLDMLRDIILTSSRPDALVLDCFAGSGNTLRAAQELGRRWIGCDADAYWANRAQGWASAPVQVPLFESAAP